jgi:hypothetical protein
MRYILGLLLALICLPSGGATDRTTYLAGLAGVPIHLFDLRSADVSLSFRDFLSEVPMTNDRPLPAALVDDTVASLAFLKSLTPPDQPSYFVAAYIQKTPFVVRPESDRTRYLQRYGEDVYPQQVCPVFISRGDATVPRLLSSAVNLPPAYFRDVEGHTDDLDRLFALTEASHCGFIARELVRPTVLPDGLSSRQLRIILEALGDFEATKVFRSTSGDTSDADEADALFAARLLATFLLDRENAYTAVPGLLYEYERIGVAAAHLDMERIVASVRLARRTVRSAIGSVDAQGSALPLTVVRDKLAGAHAAGLLRTGDPLGDRLIASLAPAIRLVEGGRVSRNFWHIAARPDGARRPPSRLVTLTGAVNDWSF